MDSKAPLVSVVTPFHNTQKYLAECIESVLRQTYQNWEYVLVNNCSTDGSSAVVAEYASRFPEKIRFIRTESFLSQVRNYNFALARISPDSKYTKMVQADDWLFPDCLRSMVEVGEAHPKVGLIAAYELEGEEVRLGGLPYPSTELPGRDVCRFYFLQHRYLFGTPTSVMMRSDLVRSRDGFYDERYAPFEDGHICFDLLKTCNFGFVHQVLTYTRRQQSSIISPLYQSGQLELLIQLVMLAAHGRDFLSQEECDRCLPEAERRYFSRMANSVGIRRKPDPYMWEFHKKSLATVNYHLDRSTLSKWLPRAIIDKCWNRFWAILDG